MAIDISFITAVRSGTGLVSFGLDTEIILLNYISHVRWLETHLHCMQVVKFTERKLSYIPELFSTLKVLGWSHDSLKAEHDLFQDFDSSSRVKNAIPTSTNMRTTCIHISIKNHVLHCIQMHVPTKHPWLNLSQLFTYMYM